ncbi:uncharacterized protein LOC133028973 [Cannabis sativa]|uniref:uncharacterized protein LOC133028973 n=1 Tax=Cannabis sativa TaxID=3483 RepID=UPI0029CA1ECD|nr:uncharacterized protein LOC133028973 [Cannabis sativa]
MIVIRMANLPALQLGFYLQLQIFSSKKALLQLRPDTIVPDNDLKVGDVCAFVMTKNIGIILFEVIIFHNNGVANSPMAMLSIPAANKKSSTTPSKPKITPCAKIEPSFTSDYDKASMISEDLIAQKIIDEPSVN